MDVWYNPAMKRMYWTHPDTMEAEVEITVVGPCQVTTDPILFHPEEGGQPADKGTIGQAVVCDVRLVEGRVVHTLDRPLADGKHTARLDAEFRGHTAANHTAQHILSGIAEATFGLKTAAVHIGSGTCTVDFDKKVGWDVAEKLEREAMEVVTHDIPVETVFNDPEVQARSRFGPIDAETVRVVKIGEYDASACCGAHVAARSADPCQPAGAPLTRTSIFDPYGVTPPTCAVSVLAALSHSTSTSGYSEKTTMPVPGTRV